MQANQRDIYLPFEAEIKERKQELSDVFTLALKFTDTQKQESYQFSPGQFNMLYLFGVGEVAISIVSDPTDKILYRHTIRSVGRVTQGLSLLKVGNRLGVRGLYGHGWPVELAKGKDILIITGGLGCAPSVSIIHYILNRRKQFGKFFILQGVKHSHDLIFREQYQQWEKLSNTQVLLAADVSQSNWPWHTGLIVDLI